MRVFDKYRIRTRTIQVGLIYDSPQFGGAALMPIVLIPMTMSVIPMSVPESMSLFNLPLVVDIAIA